MPGGDRARRIVDQICRCESRVVGTPGHDAAVAEVEAIVNALPRVRLWRQEFPVLVPHTVDAHLAIEASDAGETTATVRLYPLWPSGVRLNTTPAAGLRARLMYVGEGRSEQLPAQSLRGQIAVLESTARDNWMDAVSLGAGSVFFLTNGQPLQVSGVAIIKGQIEARKAGSARKWKNSCVGLPATCARTWCI